MNENQILKNGEYYKFQRRQTFVKWGRTGFEASENESKPMAYDSFNISNFRKHSPTFKNNKMKLSPEGKKKKIKSFELKLRKRSLEKHIVRLRHSQSATTTEANLIPQSIVPTQPEYFGSIRRDLFRKFFNETFPVIGSTPNSGKISATDPYIDPATPDFVNAYYGNTTVLPCFVNNLGRHSVSFYYICIVRWVLFTNLFYY